MIAMLQQLSLRLAVVTDENLCEVCGWIVQLSHDTREDERGATYEDRRELGRELQRLIGIAIRQLCEC